VKRATFAAGIAAASAVPRPAYAQTLPVIRIVCVPNDDVTPLLYAQQSGLFRRAGLDVTIEKSSVGAAVADAVVSGACDVGLVSLLSLLSGHAHGLPFVMIAPSLLYDSADPPSLLLVLKDSSVHSMRDLAGKVLSVSAIRSIDWVALHAYAEQFGVDPESLKFVELPMSSIPAALEAGRIQAGTISNPNLEQAMATGKFRSIGSSLDGIAKRFMVAAWCTTSDYLTKNRDLVDRFAGAMRTATLYANTHHAETAPLIAAFTGIDPAQALAMKRTTCAEYLDPREIQPVIEAAAKYKVLDHPFPAQDLISPYAPHPPR
jgi:NitT/TauT family transport system substrate-binding protein